MHRTKIDLPDNTRKAITDLLQARLADAVDLATQTKQVHWNVNGPSFIALHELFDKINGDIREFTDLIEERITTLGGTRELSDERYRDGAREWGVYQDAADPRVWIEWFFLPSWAEHLHQHEWATRHDADIHARARNLHRGGATPEVRHYLAPAQRAGLASDIQGDAS